LIGIVITLALIGGAALGLRLYLGRAAESRLRRDEIIDFAARNSAGRENVFAMCPSGFCTPQADRQSPVFAIPWERLRDAWQEMIAAQDHVEEVGIGADPHRLTYIQRSAMLRFPDVVTVLFIALGDDRSTLAIDSRSRYGKGDLGVNRRRVTLWLEQLEQRLGGGAAPSR
jgi:uncharacterized protein (DUF1499 family)